eukprot:s387_g4.t1
MVEPLGPTCCELHGAVAKAVPPTELTVTVPEDFVHGGAIKATGPFGEVSLRPPPGVQQGESICFRLAPPCQFRVTVPPWAKGGYQVRAVGGCWWGIRWVGQVDLGLAKSTRKAKAKLHAGVGWSRNLSSNPNKVIGIALRTLFLAKQWNLVKTAGKHFPGSLFCESKLPYRR